MATTGIEFGMPQVVQLWEIDLARRRSGGSSIGFEVQELITRLTSGGVGASKSRLTAALSKRRGGARLSDRFRVAQAKILWDKGWGRELEFRRFTDYLASIPETPAFPEGYDARFSRLVLVDQRVALTKACQLLGVTFDGNDQPFVPHDPAQAVTTPVYWMRCQDGRIHRNQKPNDCRTEFAAKGDEVGLSAFEGLSLYAQRPDIIDGHIVDLPGSVHADNRDYYACLRRWGVGVVGLYWAWDGLASPYYGSASRGIAGLNPRA